MALIDTEIRDTVAVVKLNNGVTNALSLECVLKLADELQKVESDPEITGLVLTSVNAKFFSIGFDIPQLFPLSEEDLLVFYRAFNRTCLELLTLPKPTIAAIPGHAIAGGCILTLFCDYRVMAEKRVLMGLNEIKLGVPVPYLADCVLQQLIGSRSARTIMETGEFYAPREALALGLVDKVLPLPKIISRSVDRARQLGWMPRLAYQIIKRNRVEPVAQEWLAHAEEKEKRFMECWFSDEARKLLTEAMQKF